MNKKIHVGVIFGGRSAEHDVSLQSARNILAALDTAKYIVTLFGIGRDGLWRYDEDAETMLRGEIVTNQDADVLPDPQKIKPIEVFFPVLHGPLGEDGTIQGLLKIAGKACVGSGVLGSALGMDKEVMKRLFKQAGLPIVKYLSYNKYHLPELSYGKVASVLGNTLFVKPANLGSSIGVHRVTNNLEFEEAIHDAFLFDTKILIEEAVQAREIECAVLGNDEPQVSTPGEIIPKTSFYSYDSKYLDEQGAQIQIPASLTEDQTKTIRELSIQAFTLLECSGLARVDFFIDKTTGAVSVNEINTLPGFTNISMYPKLWEASGLAYPVLLDRLIQLALERHEEVAVLRATRE